MIVCHDWRSRVNRALGRRSPIYDIEHVQLFSATSARELLERSGLADVRVRGIRNRYPCRTGRASLHSRRRQEPRTGPARWPRGSRRDLASGRQPRRHRSQPTTKRIAASASRAAASASARVAPDGEHEAGAVGTAQQRLDLRAGRAVGVRELDARQRARLGEAVDAHADARPARSGSARRPRARASPPAGPAGGRARPAPPRRSGRRRAPHRTARRRGRRRGARPPPSRAARPGASSTCV